jgi:hypothetical protein
VMIGGGGGRGREGEDPYVMIEEGEVARFGPSEKMRPGELNAALVRSNPTAAPRGGSVAGRQAEERESRPSHNTGSINAESMRTRARAGLCAD